MKVAMQQVGNLDWIVDSDLLNSIERISYLLWMGVRNAPPKPSKSQFMQELIEDWNTNFELCMNAMQLVNPFLMRNKTTPPEAPNQAQT